MGTASALSSTSSGAAVAAIIRLSTGPGTYSPGRMQVSRAGLNSRTTSKVPSVEPESTLYSVKSRQR